MAETGRHIPMDGLRRCWLAPLLKFVYRIPKLRSLSLSVVRRLEGGDFYSGTLREILWSHHGVKVGAYTYGACMEPGAFPSGVTIGRYVSVAAGVRVFLRNHPMGRLSLHPFFYNSRLGWVPEDNISNGMLSIGHDAWIGERAIITPGCRSIGIGSVIGAGSVVTRDVPDFAIVAGNPARLVRYRFTEKVRELILQSAWWDAPIEECARYMPYMVEPLGENYSSNPLLRSPSTASAGPSQWGSTRAGTPS